MNVKRKIAVTGLGIMGHGIADNFLKNGYEVFVWNRSPEKSKDLKGAKLAKSPKEAIEQADIVFEVTADDKSSRSIWMGSDGILAGANAEKFLITCATLSVDWVQELAEVCDSRDLTFLDMPMTGGRKGAESGQLILLVGGNKSKLQEIQSDLKAVAKDVKYFGPAGFGTKYKLILNTLQGTIVVALGEAMRMAKEVGLDERQVAESLAELPGGYTVELAAGASIKAPDPIQFSLVWETKDLNYAKQMAEKGEYPLRDIVIEKYNKADQEGYGPDDWTKVNDL